MFSQLKILDCKQGSSQWQQARIGIPTASRFNKILTSKGKPSIQKNAFMNELIAEHFAQIPAQSIQTEDMLRGIMLEKHARKYYKDITSYQIYEVGGVWHRQGYKILASPDGLIPNLHKGLEIKCPNLNNHLQYIQANKLPTKYVLQVQGCLWITDYKTWDFVSYCPDYRKQPLFICTVERDEELIQCLAKQVCQFSQELEAQKSALVENCPWLAS